jgi:cytidyltransferase-like protein|tara:strand:+ start:1237 stop:1629 length:393 start_codon:yes stop_codon:yes gene_type:complete
MTADLFHFGHVNFLKQASEIGDYLIAGIHSDETVQNYKRSPIMTMEERISVVASCRYVDEVIPDAPLIIDLKWIKKHNIHLVVHGDDFSEDLLQLCYKIPIEMGIFKKVPYTPGISTTDITNRLKNTLND